MLRKIQILYMNQPHMALIGSSCLLVSLSAKMPSHQAEDWTNTAPQTGERFTDRFKCFGFQSKRSSRYSDH